jgi:FkbM family methyltransferase
MIKYRLRNVFLNFLRSKNIFISRNEHSSDSQLLAFILRNLVQNGRNVLHIGAHEGQESEYYCRLGVSVLWIEAQPEVFLRLQKNISEYVPKQSAICALLGDKNLSSVKFHLSNNGTVSSSIYDFGTDAPWARIRMQETIELDMQRLDSLYKPNHFKDFSHCVIDVQGAELVVLQGFGDILHKFNSLQIEVSTMETYKGGAQFSVICTYLQKYNFQPLWLPRDGTHQDIIFLKTKYLFRLSLQDTIG